MHPVLLDVTIVGHQLYITSYIFFNLFLDPLVFLLVSYYLFRRKGCRMGVTLIFLASLSIMVIFFARVTHYLLYRESYLENGTALLQLYPSGFIMFGGFILVIPFLFLFARIIRFPAGTLFDLITPGWALGILFNKIGCFLNGCCFGKPTSLPWGVTYPPGSLPFRYFQMITSNEYGDLYVVTPLLKLVPVQAFESLVGLLGFLLAWLLLKRELPRGTVFLGFAAVYSAARLGLHYVREIPSNIAYSEFLPLVYLVAMLISVGLGIKIFLRSETSAR